MCSLLFLAVGLLILCAPATVMAAENTVEADVTTSNVQVDSDSGEYSFLISIDAKEAYAGVEFGVFCSDGVEITSVECSAGSSVGPKKSEGLVWFGYFSGTDEFAGAETISVKGTCEIGKESAIKIQDIRIYTVGDGDYITTNVDGGMIVELKAEPDVEGDAEVDEEPGVDEDADTDSSEDADANPDEDSEEDKDASAGEEENVSEKDSKEEVVKTGDTIIVGLWWILFVLGRIMFVSEIFKRKLNNE